MEVMFKKTRRVKEIYVYNFIRRNQMKKSKLLLLSMFFVAISISVIAQEKAPLKNLVLSSSYTLLPKPIYSYTMRGDTDMVDLTDGRKLSTVVQMWKQPGSVGWISQANIPVVVLFELKEEATLSELRFYTVGGGGAGIMDPGVEVYGSLDGKTYKLIGEIAKPKIPTPTTIALIPKKIPLKDVRAKYVLIAATPPAPTYFVFTDEIEIFGRMPANADSKLPVEGKTITGTTAEELFTAVKAAK